MRKWHLLLALSAGGAFAGFVACGGSSDNPPATGNDAGVTIDSGNDATTGVVDSGQDAGFDAPAQVCVDAGDFTDLDAGDAALGDAGASTGLCLACVQTSCSSEVTACQADCYCPSDLKDFFTCYLGGGSITSCGAALYANGLDTAEQGLATCTFTSCSTPCNLNALLDAGSHDSGSGDGSSDSGHD